ncbi:MULTISPECIES: DUF2165 family protein [unclassified Serratia (in: enterobacteria)]|uniref:DUF2165 family protein n=1 Tax=unclassified Serratia (in: enterobacteria) TaxID=2647522 RepID=UPI003B43605C
MNEIKISRFVCLVMSLFPALWGIFSFMNNITDFSDTAQHAVAPLLSMQDTYNVPGQMWRAINVSWAPFIGMAAITTMETLAGIFATIGIVVMLKNFRNPYHDFAKGKAWSMMGASFAILVWGIGFMVVAGDWFLAWQAKENPLATQMGAMMYTLPCVLTLIILMLQREPQ